LTTARLCLMWFKYPTLFGWHVKCSAMQPIVFVVVTHSHLINSAMFQVPHLIEFFFAICYHYVFWEIFMQSDYTRLLHSFFLFFYWIKGGRKAQGAHYKSCQHYTESCWRIWSPKWWFLSKNCDPSSNKINFTINMNHVNLQIILKNKKVDTRWRVCFFDPFMILLSC